MKRIIIQDNAELKCNNQSLTIKAADANLMLVGLRSDYFQQCQIVVPENVNIKDLKYCMHLCRVLRPQGRIILKGSNLTDAKKIMINLGLHLREEKQNSVVYSKAKIQVDLKPNSKLSIGIKKIEDQEIDDNELLKDENINLNKQKPVDCNDKPKACANCSCGRKDNKNQVTLTKEQLVSNINEGKLGSSCGKCYLGDSFRCGTCPYRGLPAFKPGDKLELFEEGKVIVEKNGVNINTGKVKLEL